MKQNQMNRKHMIEAVVYFMDDKSALWQSIAKIGEVKNQLVQINLSIDTAAEQQQQAQVNAGKIKAELKRTISQKADIMNDLIEVYAQMTGNKTLEQSMAQSASDLYKLKNDDMMRQVKQIISEATKHQAELVDGYGLTAEQITDLQTDYDQFMELSGQPREYQIKSAVATQSIDELLSQASALLTDQLDNLMKIFKRRDPNFYAGYQKARMVVDY